MTIFNITFKISHTLIYAKFIIILTISTCIFDTNIYKHYNNNENDHDLSGIHVYCLFVLRILIYYYEYNTIRVSG